MAPQCNIILICFKSISKDGTQSFSHLHLGVSKAYVIFLQCNPNILIEENLILSSKKRFAFHFHMSL